MIFILNSNPTSLSFEESWSFNMVPELGITKGYLLETSLRNLFPIFWFESPWRALFGLFDSLREGMGPHMGRVLKAQYSY